MLVGAAVLVRVWGQLFWPPSLHANFPHTWLLEVLSTYTLVATHPSRCIWHQITTSPACPQPPPPHQAEFCLTAEVAGGAGGRLQSMAGLDGDMYVRGGGGSRARGVLNTGQPVVRQLVRSALRHWAIEYRVDGFVLVNAENLAQDSLGGVWDSPALLEELTSDPVLRGCKLIASGGDGTLLPRGGERGVPHYGVLAEWNGRFARDVLALLRDNTREWG